MTRLGRGGNPFDRKMLPGMMKIKDFVLFFMFFLCVCVCVCVFQFQGEIVKRGLKKKWWFKEKLLSKSVLLGPKQYIALRSRLPYTYVISCLIE